MKRILIAEDNELLANLWCRALKTEQFEVVVAKNGEEVVQQARLQRPDLILMDIMMPKVDGLEAWRQIMQTYALDPPPVIFVSCLARSADMEEANRMNASDFMVKGRFSLHQLVDRVAALLTDTLYARAAV